MATRTYYDPLHKGIKLNSNLPEEEMIMKLIDSSPFQRLRRIKQLGPAYLTFHGAESSRFTHSLGVFNIARIAFNRLIELDPKLERFRGLLYAGSLLHDIGHGPLSHTSEGMFGLKHEYWSAKLIRENCEIKDSLNQYNYGLSEEVSNLIGKGQCESLAIKNLISSQLDCDRLDYLMRDSLSSGTRYGQLDLERILSALTLAPDGDIAINPKGMLAVEHYLVVRNLMYKSVYNHRLNEVANWMLEKIISIAQQIGSKALWADECISKWLWNQDEINIDVFLSNDDVRTGYHFLKWKEDSPEPLMSLCKRFIDRNLLKAIDIEKLSNTQQLESLAIARKLTAKANAIPDELCGLRFNKIHGYHPYKGGLRLWDGHNLKALEKESSLIKQLIRPYESAWLIHPKCIHEELKNEILRLGNFTQTN